MMNFMMCAPVLMLDYFIFTMMMNDKIKLSSICLSSFIFIFFLFLLFSLCGFFDAKENMLMGNHY